MALFSTRYGTRPSPTGYSEPSYGAFSAVQACRGDQCETD